MHSIREYQSSDKQQIITWYEKLQDYVVKLDPIQRLRRESKYGQVFSDELFELISKGNGRIYIALDEGEYIGFVAGFIEDQSEKNLLEVVPTKLGTITDLFVEESSRGKGIGTQLMKQMEEYLQSQGCDSLWINVMAYNPSHTLYKDLGYVDREIGMIKLIDKK